MTTKTFNTVEKPLTNRQRRILPYLAAAKSVEAGCRAAGISDASYYKYYTIPAFRRELQEMRDQLMRESMELLKSCIGKAVTELTNLLEAKSPEIRRRAATDLINLCLRWRDSVELTDRLESIETVVMQRRLYR